MRIARSESVAATIFMSFGFAVPLIAQETGATPDIAFNPRSTEKVPRIPSWTRVTERSADANRSVK